MVQTTYPDTGQVKLQVRKSSEFPNIIKSGQANFADLKAALARRHDTYDACLPVWRRNADFALSRVKLRADKQFYLLQGANEDATAYSHRVELSAFAPETPELLDDFLATLFQKEATRKIQEGVQGETAERIEAFLLRAGLKGETLEEMSRKAAKLALVYNRIDVLLDHPRDDETETPYIYLLAPDLRLDWEKDQDGKLIWCKYHEHYTTRPDGWAGDLYDIGEYRIISGPAAADEAGKGGAKGTITTYRIVLNKRTGEEQIEGPLVVEHDFHDIPVRELFYAHDAESWTNALTEIDLKIFRVESDHSFDLFEAGHPPILAWMHAEQAEGEYEAKHTVAIRRIKTGSEKVIHLNPGDSDREQENVTRMELDIAPMEHQVMHAQQLRERCRLLAGSGTAGIEEQGSSLSPKSGIALTIEREQTEKRQQIMSKNLEKMELELIELVIREGSAEDFDKLIDDIVHVQYPTSFDHRSFEESADLIQTADNMGSETLKVLVRQNVARKMVGAGIEQSTWNDIDGEIEAAVSAGEVGLSEIEMAEQDQEFQADQNGQKLKAQAQAKKGKVK